LLTGGRVDVNDRRMAVRHNLQRTSDKLADDACFFSDLIRVFELVIYCSIQLFETSPALWRSMVVSGSWVAGGHNQWTELNILKKSCLVHDLV